MKEVKLLLMVYYKFIDESTTPQQFCGWLQEGNNIITNPPDEAIIELGYKPLIIEECPSREGYSYSPTWSQTEESIIQSWIEEEAEVSSEQILSIIEGESL